MYIIDYYSSEVRTKAIIKWRQVWLRFLWNLFYSQNFCQKSKSMDIFLKISFCGRCPVRALKPVYSKLTHSQHTEKTRRNWSETEEGHQNRKKIQIKLLTHCHPPKHLTAITYVMSEKISTITFLDVLMHVMLESGVFDYR